MMVEEYVMVSTVARTLSEVDPETYIRPGYTVLLEKAHAELLGELAICRLSMGSETLAEMMLRRTGGTCYMRSDDARRFALERPSFIVEGAPTLHQPVHTAILARRKHEPIIRKGIRALHVAVMSLDM
ncbi:MAG: hypothetical protein E5Y30_38270 [Mesorhizobium sp.]|nr:MAG: hypothetical protein E5Y30_38270 [Mesorhizobium sp.]